MATAPDAQASYFAAPAPAPGPDPGARRVVTCVAGEGATAVLQVCVLRHLPQLSRHPVRSKLGQEQLQPAWRFPRKTLPKLLPCLCNNF